MPTYGIFYSTLEMLNKIRDNLTGILGTIAFHWVLILLFLILKLSAIKKHKDLTVEIEFIPETELLEQEEQIADPAKGDEYMPYSYKNIPVNMAPEMEKELSSEAYEKQVMEELGIDELQKEFNRDLPEEDISVVEELPKEKEVKEDNYTGLTTVTFYLKNRKRRYIPIPVYKCKGGGKVVVDIIVNPEGRIIQTSISKDSETQDECLFQTALEYAARSRFNIDYNALQRQKGNITYIFIPQ